jgi:hypothetical protein
LILGAFSLNNVLEEKKHAEAEDRKHYAFSKQNRVLAIYLAALYALISKKLAP